MKQIDVSDLSVGISLVRVNNPKHHPELAGLTLRVIGISPNKDPDGNSTYAVQLEHINQQPNTYYDTYSQFLKFIEPIELTDKILTNLKGSKNKKDCFANSFHFKICKTDFYLRPYCSGGFLWGFDSINKFVPSELEDVMPIIYLHEWQRLYKSITRKELNVSGIS